MAAPILLGNSLSVIYHLTDGNQRAVEMMKQRVVTAKPVSTVQTVNNGNIALSSSGRKSRASSSQFIPPPKLVILFIGIVFGAILFGIIFLHTQLNSIEEKYSIIGNANIIGNDISTSTTIEGRGAGSARGVVNCDVDVTQLVSYWDDPLSDVDRMWSSPFLEKSLTTTDKRNANPKKEKRFLSFEPDLGGWNNIRLEFEIMFVFAAATGRTLILPPDTPFYLLNRDDKARHRGFRHFFHKFDDVVDVISTEDFYKQEVIGKETYSLPNDEKLRTTLLNSLSKCYSRSKSDISCVPVFDHLSEIAAFVPDWHGEHHCLIMDDENWYTDTQTEITPEIQRFCGTRTPAFYNSTIHDAPLIHFRTGMHHKETRLLSHFYAFIYFVNGRVGNYYKRLVRNRCRYSDEIFCAAGKIVQALSGGNIDANINHTLSSYSSMHIRRGDFQWKKMRISSDEWYENTKEIFYTGETIYIATG